MKAKKKVKRNNPAGREWENREAFLKALAAHIAKTRKSKGYSQDKLGLEGNLTRGTLSKIESGRVEPMITTLAIIAEVLDVPLKKLLDFEY